MSEMNLAVTPPTATQEEINEWYNLCKEIEAFKEAKIVREMELRKKIFGFFFQEPKEGVNDYPMTGGYVMKGTYKIERKLKVELLSAHSEELHEAELPMKDLIKLVPTLVLAAYKKLREDQQKLFDKVLETKPASPSLEIVKPKKA